MKKTIRITFTILALLLCVCIVTSCTNAEVVNNNLSVKADNFECLRKITVYNARTDLIILQIEGYMSINNNSHSELVVTCKTGETEYKKNYVYLNEYVIYVIEDITGTITDPYHYNIIFYTPIPDIEVNPQ
ncbi:MAG: hypothetical protein IJF45_02560 [Clostridia bacterium]|nr:hypothetical protein [Clostridia bacterium]